MTDFENAVTALGSRFVSKIFDLREGRCWIWVGAKTHNGYGSFNSGPTGKRAHRYSYEVLCGAIPDGMVLDHVCNKRACVNPEHMRLVTPRQNAEHRRGANSNSKSGIRGVYWNIRAKKWQVLVAANGVRHFGGTYADINEAAQKAISMRKELFTHADE